ncbi:inositol monophosphatase family protein [Sphingomonas xanthus]|uniref:Histidinol-phosphatase n=1 Tax=Sphingomonas xanthus TaxID=2594473 RepID=A0A516ISR9_9SPHN|nr:inositol monophosphatase family protein [Sphingomonas xanthus]QDP19936.1 histidinol-phosphatase [Sphingomonas xanthus]
MAAALAQANAAGVSLAEFLDSLGDLARASLSTIADLACADKGMAGYDPVTALDTAIETTIRRAISSRFPDHRIWGEEQGWSGPAAGAEWSIDPVDGTRALVCGLPSWSVLVGLIEDGRHVAGLIDLPVLGERLIAVDGQTLVNGQLARASGCRRLAEARLATTDPFLFAGDERAGFERVLRASRMCRYGLDALAYARVSTGDIDLVVENGLQRHDYDALIPAYAGPAAISAIGAAGMISRPARSSPLPPKRFTKRRSRCFRRDGGEVRRSHRRGCSTQP